MKAILSGMQHGSARDRRPGESRDGRHHPHRTMRIESRPDAVLIKTSDLAAPRPCRGMPCRPSERSRVEFRFERDCHGVRVRWRRTI